MRWHFLAAVGVLLTAVLLRISALEFALLALAVTLVLVAELLNTALEVVVDLVSPEFHKLAQCAKDVAAGAVLVSAVGAVVIAYLALSHRLLHGMEAAIGHLGQPPEGEASVVSALTVIILVVLFKGRLGRGTPLHGGMPSGHAAVAFSIATSIALAQVAPILLLLTFGMATMVSQSRLLMRIHSLAEVAAGALLGIGVTLVIHFIFA
ncbi:MAG: diacylglycerol kinase [Desulfuromonadales bacterium]|nr:diacylglycerol kinase [Desulfuromonadales bacterium]